MTIVPINQSVGVLAAFSGGRCSPRRFTWNRRTYEVGCINGCWLDRHGETPTWNFSVQVGEETYYLRLLAATMEWWLDKVVTP